MFAPAVLALLLSPQSSTGTQAVTLPPAERILVLARAAHASDTAARVAARWEARLRLDPNDRAARLGLATLAQFRYDFPTASREYHALIVSEATPDRYTALAFAGLGLMTLGRESFDSTRTVLQRGEALAFTLHDSLALVETRVLLGFLASRTETTRAALAHFDRAAAVVPSGFERLLALVACFRAPSLSFGGMGDAVTEARRGLAHARASGDVRTIGFCLQTGLSVAINASGDRTEIMAAADSAEAAQRAVHDNAGLANTLFIRGYAAFALSDFGTARRALEQAVIQADSSGSRFAGGWSHRFLGEVCWLANDATSADREFQLASQDLEHLGDKFGLGGMLRIRAAIALELGRVEEADSLFGLALRGSVAAGLAEGVYGARLGLAEVRASRGDYSGARDELDALDTYGGGHGHSGWSAALEYRRGLYALRQGDFDEATGHFRRMLRGSGAAPFDRYAARSRLAELAVLRGLPERALTELTVATDALDSLRASLDDRGLRLLVFQTRQYFDEPDLGLATIVAGLVRGGLAREALALVERRRARTLTDHLAASRIFESAGRAATASAQPLRDTSPVPGDGETALVEFLTGSRSQPTTAFVLTRGEVRAILLPPLDSLRADLGRFLTLVQASGESNIIGSRLRHRLFDPVRLALSSDIRRLIIVSDAELHLLPWEALPLEDGPLGAKYIVSHAPSAAVAAQLQRQPPRGEPGRVLALGNPAYDQVAATGPYRDGYEAAGGLPALPASAREARAATGYGDRSVLRLGPEASEAFLKQARLAEFAIIHLAAHALVDDQHFTRTSLALAAGGGEDGFVTTADLSALSLSGSLVVLSACRTAGGVVIGGEGVQGLSSALLAAGARVVLATRWPIEDRATRQIAADVYRAIARGRAVDEALHDAQQRARARGAHPAEWAAFMVIGDGGMRIPLRAPAPPGWQIAAGVVLLACVLWLRRRREAYRLLTAKRIGVERAESRMPTAALTCQM